MNVHEERKTGNVLTKTDRVDLLIQTITQESFKRIQYALYEEDRVLIQNMIALEVLQAEDCIEPSLFDFFLNGPKHIAPSTQLPWGVNPQVMLWMSKVIWADLTELAKLRPFSHENLIEHIMQHKSEWSVFRNESARCPSFFDLPNRHLLSFAYFNSNDKTEIAKLAKQLQKLDQEETEDQESRSTPPSQESGRSSGPRGHTRGDSTLKRTESEILNDPEIWDVSSSGAESSDQQEKDPDEVAEDKNESEEQELARYLVENCPGVPEKKLEQLEDLASREAKLYVTRKKEAAC